MSVKETMTDDYLGTISAAMVCIELFFFFTLKVAEVYLTFGLS